METGQNFKAFKTLNCPAYRQVTRFDLNLTLLNCSTGKKMKYGLYNQAANQREDRVSAAAVYSINIVDSLINGCLDFLACF